MVMQRNPMTNYPYLLSGNSGHILFNKTLEQLRRLGARGGKIAGRNRRARRALTPTPPPPSPAAGAGETTAAAITTLDAQFPWLGSAEKRRGKFGRIF